MPLGENGGVQIGERFRIIQRFQFRQGICKQIKRPVCLGNKALQVIVNIK